MLELYVNLFGDVFELHAHLFGDVFELHVHSFGVCLNTTCTYSEWSRPAKLAQGVALLQSGITWRRRRGAVLGSPHARTEGPAIVTRSVNRVAPKVSPKMVGSLLRGNDFGGNPQEGGNNTSLPENVTSN